MKWFLFLIFALTTWAQPPIEKCFKVDSLLRADQEHYWATWRNTCPYIIDAVYVTVDFKDRAGTTLGHGVWPLYFVLPGVGRFIRFSVPPLTSEYFSVIVKEITVDAEKALYY